VIRACASKGLVIFGLLLTILGAGLGFRGVWVSEDQAAEVGKARWSGGSREEFLQLPAVKSLIGQSRYAMWGFGFIAGGTVLQIVGVLLTPRLATSAGQMAPAPPRSLRPRRNATRDDAREHNGGGGEG
jgi:hypothetical protein